MSMEFETDQEALARAITAARAGEDRALGQQVREAGDQGVRLLTGLWRLMRSHSPENHAFDGPVRDFRAVLARLVDLLGPVHLICVEGQIYVNEIRIRVEERAGGAADLPEELSKHACGGLHFGEVLEEGQIRTLLHALAARPGERRPRRTLGNRIRDAGLSSVTVTGLYRLRLSGDEGPRVQVHVPELLERAAALIASAREEVMQDRIPNPLPVRRLVNDLVDATKDAPLDRLIALTGTVAHPSPQARHAVRVCALSLLIGADLGLSSGALADLGVAAVFHDIGYAATTDGDPGFERHASAGAGVLLRQRGFHPAKIKRLLVNLQHHAGVFGGPALYARIVCIADDYDTLTRQRPTGALFNPAHALERMVGAADDRYDAPLLQLLVNRLGKYPPGSVLQLADERWVVVVSGARSPATFDKPEAKLIFAVEGLPGKDGDILDLAMVGQVEKIVAAQGG